MSQPNTKQSVTGFDGKPYSIGSRVELSPHLDLWMRGATYGTVRRIEDQIAIVRMDNPRIRKLQRIPTGSLRVQSRNAAK